MLKWSKTNQTCDTLNLIPLPEIHNSPLCPVSAYLSMINAIPSRSSNDPLLLYFDTRKALTTNTLSKFLRTFSATLCIPPLTMHQFRRLGAQLVYRAGLDFVHIKKHGCWVSDPFWHYISKGGNCPNISRPRYTV